MRSERPTHFDLKVVGPRGVILDPMGYAPDVRMVKGAVLVEGGHEKRANIFVVAITEAAEILRGILQKGPVLGVDAKWEDVNGLGGYMIEKVEDVQ